MSRSFFYHFGEANKMVTAVFRRLVGSKDSLVGLCVKHAENRTESRVDGCTCALLKFRNGICMITISARTIQEMRRDAMKRGRKSKYETNVKPRFDEIKQWAENGMSERDMAGNLDVHYSTFIGYKAEFPELNELLKKSRKHPVDDIKAAMLKRAKGFQFIEKKVIRQYIEIPDDLKDMLEDNGIDVRGYEKPQLVRTEETLKTAVPDVAAGLVLLQHWDRNEDGSVKWSRDPAKLELQKEELELKRLKAEDDYW